jgi:CMP-N-acetylneuraminic acid synthetase
MLKEDDENNVVLFTGQGLSEIKTRRQDLPEVFIRNDFVYMFNPENLYLEKPGLYGCNVELMKVSSERMDIDINTEMDWKAAEVLFKGEIK